MPLATLKDAGIGLSHLSRHEFLGRHDEVVKAVLEGNFDAGALMEEAARGYSEKGLRILALSVPIPEFNMCCNREVDEEMMNDIRNALISLDVSRPDDATVLQSLGKDCTGFEAATEAEYNVFREKILAIEADATTEHHSRLSKGRP
jgi:phosphonate transport system substrate-binding protein